MFLMQQLVRNFYETHGTFKGIEDSPYYSCVVSLWEESDGGETLSDFLYQMLGYRSLENLSIEETVNVRSFFAVKNFSKAAEVLGVETQSEINIIFKKAGISTVSFNLSVNKQKGNYRKMVRLLAHCYKNDQSFVLVSKSQVIPISYLIGQISWRQMDKSINQLFEIEGFAKSLAKVHTKKNSEIFLYGKNLYTPEILTKEDVVDLQKSAIKLAVDPSGVKLNKLFKEPLNLLFLSVSNNENYLKLLDFARGVGTTYSAISEMYGVNVVDQSANFERFGSMVYVVTPESFIVVDVSSTKKVPYRTLNL